MFINPRQAGVIAHDEVAIDLLHQVEGDADNDEQPVPP